MRSPEPPRQRRFLTSALPEIEAPEAEKARYRSSRELRFGPSTDTLTSSGKDSRNTTHYADLESPMYRVPAAQNAADTFFDVDVPLQDSTESAANVAQIVSGLLDTVDALADDVAHSDVLQALAIATAVRTAMADVSSKHGCEIPLKLLDAKLASADDGVARAA